MPQGIRETPKKDRQGTVSPYPEALLEEETGAEHP